MHTHYTLSHIQPSTHWLSHAHTFYCIYTHRLFTALMSLDDKAWQTSLFGTHFGLVVHPPLLLHPPPISLLSPLLFITPTRATQSSSLSRAPIHQHTAITCRCSVIDYFSCADVLAYQTLRKWQIRSLCPFMIMGLGFFYTLVFIRCKFVLCYIRSIFHCCVLPRRAKSRRGDKLGLYEER